MPRNIKPASAPSDRNIYYPGSSYASIILPLMEGSGATLTNLGDSRFFNAGTIKVRNYADSADDTGGWSTNSEGAVLALGTTRAIPLIRNTTSSNFVFRAGSFSFRITLPTPSGDGLIRFLWTTSLSPTIVDGNAWLVKTTTDIYELRWRVNGANRVLRWSVADGNMPDHSEPVDFLATWGIMGIGAELGGKPGVPVGSPQTYKGPLVIPAGQAMWINKGTNPGNITALSTVSMHLERQPWPIEFPDVVADPFRNFRPAPNHLPLATGWVQLANEDNFNVHVTVADDLAQRVYVQLQVDTSPYFTNPTVKATWDTNVPEDYTDLAATGLTPGACYYQRLRWSLDNSNWYPVPGGVGRVQLIDVARGPRYAEVTDTHYLENRMGSPRLPVRFGADIYADSNVPYTELTSALPKQLAAWQLCEAMYSRQGTWLDFIAFGGDDLPFGDSATIVANYADKAPTASANCITFMNQHYQISLIGPVAFVLGNHDAITGYRLIENDGQWATAKQMFRAWLRFTPNPSRAQVNTGIGEGGRTYREMLPPLEAIPPRWSANTVKSVGDRVTRTSGKQVRVFEAISAINDRRTGSSEPTWSVKVGDEVQDGNVRWRTVKAWNSEIEATFWEHADGIHTHDRRNYFAYRWGTAFSMFFADICGPSRMGQEDLDTATSSPDEYLYNPTQEADMTDWMENDPAVVKLLIRHHREGGHKDHLQVGSNKLYGRSSGNHIGDFGFFAAELITEGNCELRINAKMKRNGVDGIANHDHKSCDTETPNGPNEYTGCTPEAHTHTDPNSVLGWNHYEATIDYGTTESKGALDPDGKDMRARGLKMMLNIAGYQYFEIDPNLGWRVGVIQTHLSCGPRSNYGRFRRRTLQTDRGCAMGVATISGGAINITDAYNTGPFDNIGLILPASVVATANWWNDPDSTLIRSLFDPSSVPEWSAGAHYNDGLEDETLAPSVVKPLTPNGFMYVCWQAGDAGSSEPFSSADRTGDYVNDGTVGWAAIPIGEYPTAFYTQQVDPTSVPIIEGVSGDVVFEATPYRRYLSEWRKPKPDRGNPAGSLGAQRLLNARRRRLRL